MTYTKKIISVGSRAKVMHGTAKHTSGGLQKGDLMYNKFGRIVSKKKSLKAKKDNRLVKAGYLTKKGHFGYIYDENKETYKKMRGGMTLKEAETYYKY